MTHVAILEESLMSFVNKGNLLNDFMQLNIIVQGVEKEVRQLLKRRYVWEKSALSETLGYKEWRPFFEGKESKKEVAERWQFNEHGYARRQMTWFKKDKRINWFDIRQKSWQDKVEKVVEDWCHEPNPKQN